MVFKKKKYEKSESLEEAKKKHSHVRNYIDKIKDDLGEPEYYMELDPFMKKMMKYPNLIYPVGDPIFIHMHRKKGENMQYSIIQPEMEGRIKELYERVLDGLIELAHAMPIPNTNEDVKKIIVDYFDKIVVITDKPESSMFKGMGTKVHVNKEEYEVLKYYLIRNRTGYGLLDPLFKDPYLEDIHCTGLGSIKAVHKIFDMVFTSIVFHNDDELNNYVVETSERVERPVSDANSIVDAVMPDGSRANIIYGRDISLEGSSFTLRKFFDVPVSITQVINWGTMSADLAAYIWLCLENGMNLFVCGETASGKTTTLNAISAFIAPEAKVYTVENTPEVKMPHDVWQHLLTREGGGKDTDITYIDLLIAALRSRPNYIIVGEIRGEEGNIAFQAMQTGHPVMSTFHAGNVTTLIQRLTGYPINVPISFINNLNVVLIQSAVTRLNQKIRRVLSVTELERFYEPAQKMVTRQVFSWNPKSDAHLFRGMYNSFILEQKIAKMQGYANPRDIYKDLVLRAKILKKMIEDQIFDYFKVWEVFKKFRLEGLAGLPFEIEGHPKEEEEVVAT